MSSEKTARIFADKEVSIRIKLSGLWISVMFLFIYVDHFALFMPGVIEDAIAGKMGILEATQVSVLAATVLMAIPILMVFLSLILNAKASRLVNIIVGILYVAVVVANVIGESWLYYIFGSVVEFALLCVVIVLAWKWPRQDSGNAAE